MVELFRTNDLVRISWAQAMLRSARIPCAVADEHVSVIEGSIGAIPRRVMVEEDDLDAAERVLGLGDEETELK